MTNYGRMYRFGVTPWERYGTKAAQSIATQLDRETVNRRPGRVLDLGCGRGQYGAELAARGWEVVGVDTVPAAVEAAQERAGDRERYMVADVTSLPADLGRFDLFFDVGCLQGLGAGQRAAYGRSVTAVARKGARMLSLQFGDSRYRRHVGGITQAEVASALPNWQLISAEPAVTKGLGWPMSRTSPSWYRLQLQ